MVPQRPENYFLTDFTIEVDEPFSALVRQVALDCGFRLREDPWLIHREGMREALLRLVDRHRREGQPSPDFALCFRWQDREVVHLLEVSREAPELCDGSLDGVGFLARGLVPYAHFLKIYLAHPDDLRTAFKADRDHPLFHDLRDGYCDFLFPDDGGAAFRAEFPELLGG